MAIAIQTPTSATALDDETIEGLRAGLRGRLLLPSDDGYRPRSPSGTG